MVPALRLAVIIMLGALLALQGADRADAKIVIREKISYYPISGKTGLGLGKAMGQGGPKAINMRHAIAATATSFDFIDPKLAVENGRCVVKDLTVKLTITYHYPKWRDMSGSSAAVRRAWKTFYNELQRHEQTHGRIAKKYAARVEREMKSMSGTVMFGCQDFGQWTTMRMKGLAAQLKAEQAAFDAREDRATSRITRLQVVLLKSK